MLKAFLIISIIKGYLFNYIILKQEQYKDNEINKIIFPYF